VPNELDVVVVFGISARPTNEKTLSPMSSDSVARGADPTFKGTVIASAALWCRIIMSKTAASRVTTV
jgi:hypothetical protein